MFSGQKMEVGRQSSTKTQPTLMAISPLHTRSNPVEEISSQEQVMTTRTRLNVTACLYLSLTVREVCPH